MKDETVSIERVILRGVKTGVSQFEGVYHSLKFQLKETGEPANLMISSHSGVKSAKTAVEKAMSASLKLPTVIDDVWKLVGCEFIVLIEKVGQFRNVKAFLILAKKFSIQEQQTIEDYVDWQDLGFDGDCQQLVEKKIFGKFDFSENKEV